MPPRKTPVEPVEGVRRSARVKDMPKPAVAPKPRTKKGEGKGKKRKVDEVEKDDADAGDPASKKAKPSSKPPSVAKPASKASNKPASKASNKPASKASNKPASKASNKPASKVSNKPASKGKPSSQIGSKKPASKAKAAGTEEEKENAVASTVEQPIPEDPEAEAAAEKAEADAQDAN